MSTAQAFLGNSAPPHGLEHGGRTYRFRRLDRAGMAAFSVWLIEWTRSRLVALYGHDQRALAAALARLESEVMEGRYEFEEEKVSGQPVWRETTREIDGRPVRGREQGTEGGVLHTLRGQVQLASILCSCTPDEAADLLMARPAEAGHLLALTLNESFPQPKDSWEPLAEGNAEGPGQEPEQAPAA